MVLKIKNISFRVGTGYCFCGDLQLRFADVRGADSCTYARGAPLAAHRLPWKGACIVLERGVRQVSRWDFSSSGFIIHSITLISSFFFCKSLL